MKRGACDKLFLTTTGIGVIREGIELGAHLPRPGDAVLVNGVLGDHGAAILAARGDLVLDAPIDSDCAPLHGLVAALLAAVPGTRFCAMPRAAVLRRCSMRSRNLPAAASRSRKILCRSAKRSKGFAKYSVSIHSTLRTKANWLRSFHGMKQTTPSRRCAPIHSVKPRA